MIKKIINAIRKTDYLTILITIGLIAFCIGCFLIVMDSVVESVKQNIYYKCCNNVPCSDTYYTLEDNTCHLTLCENNSFIFNKTKCLYPAREDNLTFY